MKPISKHTAVILIDDVSLVDEDTTLEKYLNTVIELTSSESTLLLKQASCELSYEDSLSATKIVEQLVTKHIHQPAIVFDSCEGAFSFCVNDRDFITATFIESYEA